MSSRCGAYGGRALAAPLVLLVLLTGCGRKQPSAVTDTGPPRDLLLVTLDTFRVDRAGCYGNPEGLTPSIDRALRSALLLGDAFAPAPLTAVSHATMLTGLEPYHHGVRDNALFPLADSVATLAEHLGQHGFTSAAFIAGFPLSKRFGFGQGFTTYDDELGPDPGAETFFAERPAREVVDRALAWVATLRGQDHAFLWTHFFDPHHPHRPLRALRALPVTGDYEREIRGMDRQIGRLLRGLEAAGRRPLVVIVSDHGEGLGDHKEQHHCILLHDETMHGLLGFAAPRDSPLATRLRGLRRGVARYTDIAPTVLDALGVEAMPDLDGGSLLTSTSSEGAYGESYYSMLHYRWSPLLSWRDERWTYIEGPHPELYDRFGDPGERHDVIREHPDIAETFSKRIADVAHAPEASSAQELDAESREKLAALGYVATSQAGFDPKKDPKDFLDGLNSLYQGLALLDDGHAQAALPLIQTAYRGDPDNPLAAYYLATCWRELGDAATAMSYYRRAIEIDPRGAKAWAHLGLLRFQQGDAADALKILEDGLKANPDAFPILMTAGELSRDVGRAEAARRYLMRATEVAPTRPEPWESLAQLEDRLGHAGAAAKFRERARTLTPHRVNSEADAE